MGFAGGAIGSQQRGIDSPEGTLKNLGAQTEARAFDKHQFASLTDLAAQMYAPALSAMPEMTEAYYKSGKVDFLQQ
jgi:hypothetical protein